MMDEDQLLNEQSRVTPGAAQEPPAEEPVEGPDPELGASREASEEEERMFATMVKQVLVAVSSEESTEMVLAIAKNKGPAEAVAEVVANIVSAIQRSAGSAGIQITDEVGTAAAGIAVADLAGDLAKARLAEDAQATAVEAMDMIKARLAEID